MSISPVTSQRRLTPEPIDDPEDSDWMSLSEEKKSPKVSDKQPPHSPRSEALHEAPLPGEDPPSENLQSHKAALSDSANVDILPPPVVIKTAEAASESPETSASESEESDSILPQESSKTIAEPTVTDSQSPVPQVVIQMNDPPPPPRLPWYKRICPCWTQNSEPSQEIKQKNI